MHFPARPVRSSPLPASAVRVATLVVLLLSAASLSACSKDRLKRALGDGAPPGDSKWASDSGLLASSPEVLFKAFHTDNGTEIAPIGTIGRQGFKGLRLGDRGWRAFDLQYFHGEAKLQQVREGHSIGTVTMKRGMWGANGPPLDSLAGCTDFVPSGLASVSEGVRLLTVTPRKPLTPALPVSDGEVANAINQAEKLVAPRRGIRVEDLSKYARTVHRVNSGKGTKPTIVVVYDDPEIFPDTGISDGQRPRHLVVFFDWGIYGYKATWIYATLGNKNAPPRLQYLDYLDVNDDGLAEVLFGVRVATDPLYTIIVRRDVTNWIEETRQTRRRCQG